MMSADLEVEPYYLREAQEFVDMLVDKGFIRDDVSREETRALEDYVGYLFQSRVNMTKRTTELMRKYKDKEK
jgi:acyl-[acyl carrier protein]--UDP-N-acetylglucosamine O-acyltransferase